MEKEKFKGRLIVLTAPSGAGKTTIRNHLLATYDEIGFSVSAATREKRAHEEEGKDYYFMSNKKFRKLIKEDAFIEWEEVYQDQFYGTLKSEIERLWKEEKHIIFDIDVHGAADIKKMYGKKCLCIFVKPPSLEVIIRRLMDRKTETETSLKKRIKRITKEMKWENKFDVILVNDLLEVALKEAELITESFLNIKEAIRE